MSTQVIHTAYIDRTGYVWRQRYAGFELSISLKSKDEKETAHVAGLCLFASRSLNSKLFLLHP